MNRTLKIIILSTVIATSSAACAEEKLLAVPQKPQLTVGQIQLWLEDRSGKCHVMALIKQQSTTEHSLDIPWPCQFHTDNKGNIRTLQEGGYIYSVAESSRRMPQPSRDCETQLQSIRIRDTVIEVSQHKERVAACPPFQWDTMIFKELFN